MQRREFSIGGWLAPANTKEAYKRVKACGINTMYLLGGYSGYIGDELQAEAVRICRETGVQAIPIVSKKTWRLYDETLEITDNIPAVMLYDEPKYTDLEFLSRKMEEFYRHYSPNVRCEINLYPNYIPLDILGAESYEQYVEAYAKLISEKSLSSRVLSVDFYPIRQEEGKLYLSHLWLRCLSVLSYFAVKYRLPLHCFIQTMAYGKQTDVSQNFESLKLQFMTYLAFGFSSFTHFCYATPSVSEEFFSHQLAIVDRVGNPTTLYGEVQEVNTFVQSFSEILSYRYDGTAIFVSENSCRKEHFETGDFCLKLSDLKELINVKNNGDLLIGKYSKEGGTAYFITYYALPNETSAEIQLYFENKASKVWRNGKPISLTAKGHLQMQLKAGDGVLFELKK